jgi:hypothetical protein
MFRMKKTTALTVASIVIVVVVAGMAFGDLRRGLVAYYPLNGDGTDLSGNHNNGVVHGATPAMDHLGNPEGAVYFRPDSPGGDYIRVPDSPSLHVSPNITIAMWVKVPVAIQIPRKERNFIWKHEMDVSNYPSYGMGTGPEGSTNEIVFTFGHNSWEKTTGYGLQDNTWTHVVATFDDARDELKFYRDGRLFQTVSTTRSIGVNSAALYIHGYRYADHVVYTDSAMTLDEICIYNRVLSDAEVAELHTHSPNNPPGDAH